MSFVAVLATLSLGLSACEDGYQVTVSPNEPEETTPESLPFSDGPPATTAEQPTSTATGDAPSTPSAATPVAPIAGEDGTSDESAASDESEESEETVAVESTDGIVRPPETTVSPNPVTSDPENDQSSTTGPTITMTTSEQPSTTSSPTVVQSTGSSTTTATTAAPTTATPTTAAPTTAAPTTAVPTTAAPTTAVPTTVPPSNPAVDAWAYIGQPLASHALANMQVTGDSSYAYAFTARDTARLRRIQVHIAIETSRPGYASGTGGTTTFSLRKGSPEGPELASADFTPGLTNGQGPAGDGSSGVSYSANHPINFPTFDLPADLIAGQRYFIVASNPSMTDYVSINHGYATRSARGPIGPDTSEFGLLRNWFDGAGWVDRTTRGGSQYAPALLLETSAGNYGNSAADPRYDDDQTVTGSRSLRQTFQIDSATRVQSLAMSTTGGGKVRVTLGSTSVVVDTAGGWNWDNVPFDVSLSPGQHTLLIEPVSGSVTFGVFRYGESGLGKVWPQGGSWDGGVVESNSGSGWQEVHWADADLVGVALATS